MQAATLILHDSAAAQRIFAVPAARGCSFASVSLATAHLYDAAGGPMGTPSVTTIAATDGTPLTLYVEQAFPADMFPVARDYRVAFEVSGVLNDGNDSPASIVVSVGFDVVSMAIGADITRYDLLTWEPELAYVDVLRSEAGAAAYIMQAYQRLAARLRATAGYRPDGIIDVNAWQACLVAETLSLVYMAYPDGEKALTYRARCREHWRLLAAGLRLYDENGNTGSVRRVDAECRR